MSAYSLCLSGSVLAKHVGFELIFILRVGSENRLGPIENGKPNIQCTRDYPLHVIGPNHSNLLKKLSSVMKLLERLNFQLSRDHY